MHCVELLRSILIGAGSISRYLRLTSDVSDVSVACGISGVHSGDNISFLCFVIALIAIIPLK